MFKKEPVQERSKSLLKNKDIRAFRQALVAAFPRLSKNISSCEAAEAPNPLADAPFLEKSQVSTSKLGSHGVLYSCPEGPIAFEPRDGDVPGIVPSLYFLCCYTHALRRIEIHSPVSEYILNGADLMLPGVVSYEYLRDIELKECVAIAVQGNPIPFAVGLSTVSWEGVQHNGLRGKGVRILHVFGDYLCHKWNKNRPLNEGFSLTRIRPTEPIPSEAKEEDVVEEGGECGGAENVSTQANEPELGEAEAILDEACEEAVIDTLMDSLGVLDLNEEYPDFEEEQDGLDLEEDEESVNAGAARADASEGPGPEQQLSGTEEEKRTLVDNLLERCLLRAFHYIIKDKFLPVLVSSLWAILLKCYVDNESPPDIKKSSYRKVSVLLKRFVSLGLLEMKDDGGVSSVLSVQRDHALFRQSTYKVADAETFRTMVSQRGQVASEENVAKQRTSGVNSSAAARGGDHAINVVKLLKLPKPLVDVFGNVEGEYGRFLTSSEARNLLLGYISEQNFEVSNRGASVSIPPESPLFKLLRLGKSRSTLTEVRESVASSTLPTSTSRIYQDQESDDEEQGSSHESEGPRMVAGVMVSSISELARTSQMPSVKSKAVRGDVKSKAAVLSQPSKISVYNPGKKPSTPTAAAVAVVAPSEELGRPQEPEVVPPTSATITKQDIVNRFEQKLTPYYAVVNKRGEYKVMSGNIPRVLIEVEKRAGNKLVTRLSGLEPFDIDGNVLGKDCQKKFACSTSYTTIDGRPGKSELVLQGLHVDDLTELLVRDYGLPKTIVESHLGKGVKAKGKH